MCIRDSDDAVDAGPDAEEGDGHEDDDAAAVYLGRGRFCAALGAAGETLARSTTPRDRAAAWIAAGRALVGMARYVEARVGNQRRVDGVGLRPSTEAREYREATHTQVEAEEAFRNAAVARGGLTANTSPFGAVAVEAAETLEMDDDDEEAAAAAAELLAPLTREQLDLIAEATGPGPTLEVIASGTFTGQDALEMTRKDVATMAPGEWLNDEMVNFTIGGMADRERARRGAEQPRVHFFNTFFVNKLCDGHDGYNYNAVRRWTTKKKLGYDLLACDKVIIPVHQGIHWVLAVVDLLSLIHI